MGKNGSGRDAETRHQFRGGCQPSDGVWDWWLEGLSLSRWLLLFAEIPASQNKSHLHRGLRRGYVPNGLPQAHFPVPTWRRCFTVQCRSTDPSVLRYIAKLRRWASR